MTIRSMAGLLLAAASLLPVTASAQSVEEFYRGRQINMLIGGGAGGGYDVYYRALARHLGKHIPGHPSIIPRNQPAASGLAAAAALYTTAEKDGATIGADYAKWVENEDKRHQALMKEAGFLAGQ